MREIHRQPMSCPLKGPVMRKAFLNHYIMIEYCPVVPNNVFINYSALLNTVFCANNRMKHWANTVIEVSLTMFVTEINLGRVLQLGTKQFHCVQVFFYYSTVQENVTNV